MDILSATTGHTHVGSGRAILNAQQKFNSLTGGFHYEESPEKQKKGEFTDKGRDAAIAANHDLLMTNLQLTAEIAKKVGVNVKTYDC